MKQRKMGNVYSGVRVSFVAMGSSLMVGRFLGMMVEARGYLLTSACTRKQGTNLLTLTGFLLLSFVTHFCQPSVCVRVLPTIRAGHSSSVKHRDGFPR